MLRLRMTQLATLAAARTPALVSAAGERAAYRFLEFFTAQIRNPHPPPLAAARPPALVGAAGGRAAYRFLKFSTAQTRTPPPRRAYVRAVGEFCAWLEAHGVTSIAAVGSIHVAAYVEDLGHRHS